MADTVPAMLESGEYVLNRNAVKAIGKNKLDKLNFDMAPRDLLSRTDEGEYVIPAGKNILGQSTKEMGMDELMEMIMPVGAAQMGKGGIKAIMSSNKEDILNRLSKMRKTGKGSKKVAENVDWQTELIKYLKEATSRRFTNPVVKKQHGGIVEDHSLMDYMMPTLDKRLGKPLKKMQGGGLIGGYSLDFQGNLMSGNVTTQQDWQQGVGSGSSSVPSSAGLPSTTAGSIGFGGSLTGTAQQTLGSALGTASAYTPPVSAEQAAQQSIQQPSSSYSTSIADIFKEAGVEIPDADYLSGIEAYDPTKQNRLREKLSFKAFETSPFASAGQEKEKIRQQRKVGTQTYMQGAQDLRTQYREDILAQIAEDMGSGMYGFEEREEDPYMG